MLLRIDPDFRAYIPALSDEERAQLEQNIVAEGCRDPLVVWGDVLIDGHNRYEICTRLGLPFVTVAKEFPDREAALDWMDAHQLGRRNLTPDARRLLLGRRYNRVKKGDGERGPQKLDQNEPASTAAKLAKEHGVSEATVKRAGKFAEEVEAKPELKAAVEAGRPVAKAKREASQVEASPAESAPAAELDPMAKIRREIARLSQDGMIDEIIGLRDDLAEAKLQVEKLKAERDDLSAKLKEATQADLGRALGNAQRRADAATGRMKEFMAANKRLEYRLKKAEDRVKELEETPIDMGPP